MEHANFEDLEKALAGLVGSYEDENFFDITKTDLMRLGLLMGSDSRKTTGISRRSLAYRLLQWQAITQTLGVVWN